MADYPITPNRITNIKSTFKTNVLTFENGVEQRSQRWRKSKKTFRLEHYFLDSVNQKTLTDFFDEQKGQSGSFSFYNYRDGQTYTVRFNSDELDVQAINAGYANISVEVVTC